MDADLGLGRFPRVRLTDATPLHPLRRLSAALGGPEIWMKRDDLTGFAMGGNKARKLEFLVADAQARGADTLVTAGAIQSNHVRQTAAAAAIHGMACRAVVQNVFSSTDRDYLTNGNALLFDLFGASIVTVPTDADLEAALAREVEAVRAAGRGAYARAGRGASPPPARRACAARPAARRGGGLSPCRSAGRAPSARSAMSSPPERSRPRRARPASRSISSSSRRAAPARRPG